MSAALSKKFIAEAAHRVAVWKESHPTDDQLIGKADNEPGNS